MNHKRCKICKCDCFYLLIASLLMIAMFVPLIHEAQESQAAANHHQTWRNESSTFANRARGAASEMMGAAGALRRNPARPAAFLDISSFHPI